MDKVLICADLHIDSHKNSQARLQDCLDVLEWICKTAREHKVLKVIIAGDLFQHRQKIQTYIYQSVFKLLQKNSDIIFDIILGNHDLWYYEDRSISSVIPFSALSNINVYSDPITVKIGNQEFDYLPFTHDPLVYLQNFKNKENKVLCAHIAVDGAILHLSNIISETPLESEKEMTRVTSDKLKDYKHVFMGHYHCEQRLTKNVEYVGSAMQLNFGEANQKKHIVLLNLEPFEVTYIENNFSPKHYIINENEIDKIDLNNSFVNVRVKSQDSVNVLELQKILQENYDLKSLKIIQEKPKEKTEIIEEVRNQFLNEKGEIFEKYVKSVNKNLNPEMLLNIAKEIQTDIEL